MLCFIATETEGVGLHGDGYSSGLKGKACEDLKVSPENGKNHWSKSETGKEPLVKDLSRFSCPGEKSPLSVPTRITV